LVYWDAYYSEACDLIYDYCVTYYADYYESGELDNGYAWEYYEDPHGVPCFGWEYDPLGFDEDSEYGVYQNYYEFDLPSYFSIAREDTVGCYSDLCVSTDGGLTEECSSTFNDYYFEEILENSYESYYLDCGDEVYADYEHYYSSYDNYNGDYGSYFSYQSGPENPVDEWYFYYDDGYYEEGSYLEDGAYIYYDIYHDYYENILYDECSGEYWLDADNEYGYTEMYCEYDDGWTTYDADFLPEEEGDDTAYYYFESHDTWYHVWCYDFAQLDCEDQYDDYYNAGTIYYAEGEVYYWEVYAMPDEETYHGRHVHAALDGSSYSVYRFSEPDGVSFTYYETPEFASTYDYASGDYTEWLQDFYGEIDSELLQFKSNGYVGDDSDDLDDFNA